MKWKLLALCILTITALWNVMLRIADVRSVRNPIPENVRKIYDEATYIRWRTYKCEKSNLAIVSGIASFALTFLMLALNVYAFATGRVSSHPYIASFIVAGLGMLAGTLVDTPSEYVNTMVIEEKYGFNRRTKKVFVTDQVKNFVITVLLEWGILSAFIALYRWLGIRMVFAFATVLIMFVLAVSFLTPFLLKIFNKFIPLEEGELRKNLTSMMEKNGYSVREIKVMDASRRSSKANACFTGFGKTKTIILFDTLLESMETDEICAVFAHEMGHGLNRDTLRIQVINTLQIVCISLLAWLTVCNSTIYSSFGFKDVNYGFALLMMEAVEMPLLSPLFGVMMNAYSRKAEYRADLHAVNEGYGEALISALKKLSKDNFSNLSPSRMNVWFEYSHPPLSERIAAIENSIRTT